MKSYFLSFTDHKLYFGFDEDELVVGGNEASYFLPQLDQELRKPEDEATGIYATW